MHDEMVDFPKFGQNLQLRCLPLLGGHIPNLKKISSAIPEIWAIKLSKNSLNFSSFCTLWKNCYNLHMSTLIWLKFRTCIGGLKANTSIKFGVNLLNIEGVISDFTHKAKPNFCHAYGINCFKEQAENRYVARLNIRGVPWWLEIDWVRDNRGHMRLGKNHVIDFA